MTFSEIGTISTCQANLDHVLNCITVKSLTFHFIFPLYYSLHKSFIAYKFEGYIIEF
jgi:hypothetical protein